MKSYQQLQCGVQSVGECVFEFFLGEQPVDDVKDRFTFFVFQQFHQPEFFHQRFKLQVYFSAFCDMFQSWPATELYNKKAFISALDLNLPNPVTIAGKGTISYLYDATGNKLKKTYGSNVSYYQGSVLKIDGKPMVLTGEGRAVKYGTGNWEYEYDLKDHLGNTRVSFFADSVKAKPLQYKDYYPFGMEMANWYHTQPGSTKYLYNGKELQDEGGLNWYDYGARFYDPALGRWHSPDPHAEKYSSWSPYNYAFSNPINVFDPNGKDGELVIDGNKMVVKVTLNYSQESLDKYNSKKGEFTQEQFQNDFKNYYEAATGQYEMDGQKYDVSFDVSFNVVSKDADMPSANAKDGTTNLTFDAKEDGPDFHSGNVITLGSSPRGMAGAQDTGGSLSHEIIHGLGVADTHERESGKLSSYSQNRSLQQSEVSQMLLPAIQFSKENNITHGSVLITHSRGRDTQGNLIPREKPIRLK